jgi:hypothetical protein
LTAGRSTQKRTRERLGKRKRCLFNGGDKKENLKEEVKKIYKRQRFRKETSSKGNQTS